MADDRLDPRELASLLEITARCVSVGEAHQIGAHIAALEAENELLGVIWDERRPLTADEMNAIHDLIATFPNDFPLETDR